MVFEIVIHNLGKYGFSLIHNSNSIGSFHEMPKRQKQQNDVHTAKTQISLSICCLMRLRKLESIVINRGQREDVNAQAD